MTPKQEQFVREFLIDLNATQAAIRAGYSERTANEQAARLMKNHEIMEAIDAAKIERSKSTNIAAGRVLSEIANMAFYDIADIMIEIGEHDAEAGEGYRVSDDGKLYGLRGPTDIRALPENVRRAIVGYNWDKAGNFVIKLADKSKALDQLARHLSLYNDKIEVTAVDALSERLARARSRMDEADRATLARPVVPAPIAPAERVSRASEAEVPGDDITARSAGPEPSSKPLGADDLIAAQPPAPPPYSPLLPQRQAFADCNYENDPSGFLSHYRNDERY